MRERERRGELNCPFKKKESGILDSHRWGCLSNNGKKKNSQNYFFIFLLPFWKNRNIFKAKGKVGHNFDEWSLFIIKLKFSCSLRAIFHLG